MSYGFAAGKPIAALAVSNGASDLWKNLPVLIIVLAGGFTTNLLWCGFLNIRNKTGGNYIRGAVEVSSAEASAPRTEHVPLLANYALCAVAGTLWYMQFFFYGMGTTKMGRYDFSSWTLHMATIIIFGTLVGVGLSEWRGVSQRTYRLMQLGLVVLVSSTVVIGYGNYLAKEHAPAAEAPKVSETPADSPKVAETPPK
jgi:L-rhamnose-H+ transport protein